MGNRYPHRVPLSLPRDLHDFLQSEKIRTGTTQQEQIRRLIAQAKAQRESVTIESIESVESVASVLHEEEESVIKRIAADIAELKKDVHALKQDKKVERKAAKVHRQESA